jgi:hypothetical protein
VNPRQAAKPVSLKLIFRCQVRKKMLCGVKTIKTGKKRLLANVLFLSFMSMMVAMKSEGLTECEWEWLGMNQISNRETEGPGGEWLDGIREDTKSSACKRLDSACKLSDTAIRRRGDYPHEK